MSTVQINGTVTPAIFKESQIGAVFVRPAWSGTFDWEWVPFLEPVHCEYKTAPSLSTAQFEWTVGEVKQIGATTFPEYDLLNLADYFVGISVINSFTDWTAWVGLIQSETLIEPSVDQGITTMRQVFGAVGLEYLLQRRRIIGSYVDGDILIDRNMVFNERHGRGASVIGNRSTNKGARGAYTFSTDGKVWTNWQIIEHIMEFYQPPNIPFPIYGAWFALDQIVDVHDLTGLTVYDALNRLIDRRRGFAWNVLASFISVQITISTQLSEPIRLGEVEVPANSWQRDIDLTGLIDVKTKMSSNRAHLVDTIIARGQRIKCCGTIAFLNSTLTEGWSSGNQTTYESLTDEERRSDALERVYRHYKIPAAWNWELANLFDAGTEYMSPAALTDGTVDHTANGAVWNSDHRFESFIPFEMTGGISGEDEVQFRRPFVLVEDPDTADEYHYIENLDELEFKSASVGIADRELTLIIRPAGAPPHVLGLNDFVDTEPTDHDPEVDYTSMIATVFFAGDSHLKVEVSIPANDLAGLGKTLYIDVPHAEYWFAAKGTVEDVDENKALVYRESGDPAAVQLETIRDDGLLLRTAALGAMAWYSQQRNTIEWEIAGLSPQMFPGVLVRLAASSAHTYDQVGTTVTSWRLDFGEEIKTTVKTGFAELDTEAFKP